jgi:hypothetical protein
MEITDFMSESVSVWNVHAGSLPGEIRKNGTVSVVFVAV